MIRLFIADDHVIFRQGLAHLLKSHADIDLVGEAGRGDEAIHQILDLSPDVAVLDLSMPGMNGIEITKQLRSADFPTQIVILTMHDDPTLAIEAQEAGALGYVVKDYAFSELLDAIHSVQAGRRFYSKSVLEKVDELDILDHSTPALSPREREVVAQVAAGKTNKEIGRLLGISPKTVDTHRTRLMKKLKVHTTADMVRYAIRVGLA
ncbi:MAG: response regulator transcription factor [Magnetococcales bacterium]|nr:response regulator transcription factor [Magnetococcales bacterium]